MAKAHLRVTTTTVKTRTRKKVKSNSNLSKNSGQKRCPSCGRYM